MVKKIKHAAASGLTNVDPAATVTAAAIAGLPLPLALAMLSQESAGGLNIWGDDSQKGSIFTGGKDAHGRQWGNKVEMWHTVTKAGYNAYQAQQREILKKTGTEVKQGVGPTQLTDPQLQADADAAGGAWKPLPNLIIGFSRLAYLVNTYDLDGGLERYNGAPAYDNPVLEKAREWAAALGWKSVVSKR